MAEKALNTKIALLYKTKEEWDNDKDYIPKKGEVCFCEYPNGNAFAKVGNGIDTFENLSWLKANHGDLMFYFGASYDRPTDLSNMTRVAGMIKQDLIEQGKQIIRTIDVEVDPVREIGQYPTIAIDKRFKLTAWKQAAAPDLPTNSYVSVDKGDYTLYYLTSPVTKDIEYLFIFEIGG